MCLTRHVWAKPRVVRRRLFPTQGTDNRVAIAPPTRSRLSVSPIGMRSSLARKATGGALRPFDALPGTRAWARGDGATRR